MPQSKLRNIVWPLGLSVLTAQIIATLAIWNASDQGSKVLLAGGFGVATTFVFLLLMANHLRQRTREIADAMERSAIGDVRNRLEALRSDFAANVSHELRTPITNIKGYVETLLEVGVTDSEQTARFLGVIHHNTERLAFIIEDLLSLARLEQPGIKGTLNRVVTPVQNIVQATLTQLENERIEKQIQIVQEVQRDVRVNVNAQLMEQAIGNLLSNAIKYSPPNTKVVIRAGLTRRSEVEISISDHGPGIAKEHLSRLFERFYRVDRARSREVGGTGLGLAIVKHIALVHGGRVDVESEVGRGSTFRIILPTSAT